MNDKSNYPVFALMAFNLIMCIVMAIWMNNPMVQGVCLILFGIQLLIGGIMFVLLILNKILE